MENQISNEATMKSNRVTLELLGIEKKWIWVKNSGWVELKENNSPTMEFHEDNEMDDLHSNKWWKFW